MITTLFKDLKKLEPFPGEDRMQFFKRQFKGYFDHDMWNAILRFINLHAHQPMLPYWPHIGCYPLSAIKVFNGYPMIISAIWVGDCIWCRPQVERHLLSIIRKGELDRFKTYLKFEKTSRRPSDPERIKNLEYHIKQLKGVK